jgi:elongation factor Tu
MDGAILVSFRFRRGPDAPGPVSHPARARQVGVPYIVVFMNKCDRLTTKSSLSWLRLDIRDLLNQYEFPGDDTPIIKVPLFWHSSPSHRQSNDPVYQPIVQL